MFNVKVVVCLLIYSFRLFAIVYFCFCLLRRFEFTAKFIPR